MRLNIMDRDECLEHLSLATVGRFIVVVDHYPQVFPVNYRLDQWVVVFRTNLGTKLLAARHDNVAFQVDHLDQGTHSGWSVLIQGMAEDVTERTGVTAQNARDLDLSPWPGGSHPRVVRIIPARITGRQLAPGATEFWGDDRSQLHPASDDRRCW